MKNSLLYISKFQNRRTNTAAWHLYFEHGCNRRSDVRHFYIAIRISGRNIPSHPYQWYVRIKRIPQTMICAFDRSFPPGADDHCDIATSVMMMSIDESVFDDVGPGCRCQIFLGPSIDESFMAIQYLDDLIHELIFTDISAFDFFPVKIYFCIDHCQNGFVNPEFLFSHLIDFVQKCKLKGTSRQIVLQ